MIIKLKDSLGVPREQMPQITGNKLPMFVKWIFGNGYKCKLINEPVNDLNLTQSNLNINKIKDIISNGVNDMDPIICSSDLYILDGHHRVAALQNQSPNELVKIIRVELPINDLLKLCRDFPGVEYKGINEMKKIEKLKNNLRGKKLTENQLRKIKAVIKEENTTGEGEVVRPPIDIKEYLNKYQALESIKEKLSNSNYMEIFNTVKELVEEGSQLILTETEEWFDKVSTNRDIKILNDSLKVFEKTCQEMQQLDQRLKSTYDNIGSSLAKYF